MSSANSAAQTSIDGFEAADINTLLRRDRDRYRKEGAETRAKYTLLQDSAEILKCEKVDLQEELRQCKYNAARESEDLRQQLEALRAELDATRVKHGDVQARHFTLRVPLGAPDTELHQVSTDRFRIACVSFP